MKNRIFVAVLIVFVLVVARSIFGQSIMLSSNGQSIMLSSRHVPQEAVVRPATQEAAVRLATPDPVVDVTPHPEPVKAVPAARQRYLVSESWCPHCPAARGRFLAKGWSEKNVITIAEAKSRFGVSVTSVPYEFEATIDVVQPAVLRQRQPPARYIQWPGWGQIDLAMYNRDCNCGMCQSIRAKQQEYRRQLQLYNQQSRADPAYKASQEATPPAVVDTLLKTMRLTSRDVLADLGCGDGRILIHAVRTFGCKGVGIEIDPEKAEEARTIVRASGLSSQIEIITADATEFDPSKYAVTAITAHLYEPLLKKLVPQFSQAGVRVVASPYHEVPGLAMQQINGIWIHRRIDVQL